MGDLEPEFKAATNGANEGVVDFKVTIDEGRQFRLREIRFQGSNLPEKELLSLLRIRAGDIFNQRLFEESIDELNKLGRYDLIDKDRDSDFSTDEELGLIDLVIKLNNRDSEVGPGQSALNSRQP
jgi:outer membrane protein assembly factor BamA